MKKITTFAIILLVNCIFAQVPAGYYSTATATGYTLKTQLYNKIKGHIDQGYNGLWTTYATSDRDKEYENDNSIIDLYSEKPTTTDPYTFIYGTSQCGTYSTEGNCYNREHMIPQSIFNSAAPMVSDAHFIPPVDGKVNGIRSNYPHGNVALASFTSLNGSKLGTSAVSGYTGTVFEPINEFKGDIARMYFYFATRYENTVATYTYAMFNGTSNQVFTTPFLNMLLAWHNNDPVSAREIARNNAIYARQGNRNPFIDNPSFANSIWGGGAAPADTTAPTAPTAVTFSAITTNSINLTWVASADNVAVVGYDVYVNNVLKISTSTNFASITNLTAATSYTFYVKAKDAAANVSSGSAVVTASTISAGATELFFSEYIEGSSNNKVLEIANKTSGSIALASYTIKKQTNGAGAWSTGLALTGTLVANGKYTIVNSGLAATCYNISSANNATSAAEMTFNGNDAIGLFKNGLLIDIIGTFNGGVANFSADETLRRKATVIAPTTTFNKTAQWDVFALDTCSGIGNKISSENVKETVAIANFSIYPNPSNGDFTIEFDNASAAFIEIFSLHGQSVFENTTTNSSLNVHLQSGLYVVKVTANDQTVIKKISIK